MIRLSAKLLEHWRGHSTPSREELREAAGTVSALTDALEVSRQHILIMAKDAGVEQPATVINLIEGALASAGVRPPARSGS